MIKTDTKAPFWQQTLHCSMLGIARGTALLSVLYPIDVMKTWQQIHGVSVRQAASQIFDKQGVTGYYTGLSNQVARIAIKQAWCWPIIGLLPPHLERYKLKPAERLAATGIAIASIDAFFTSPLERRRILAIADARREFSFATAYKGSLSNFTRLSVAWVAFLVSQQYFRNDCKIKSGKTTLEGGEYIFVALKVSLITSLLQSPFDVYKTFSQMSSTPRKDFFSGNFTAVVRRMSRGFPLSLTASIIQNIVSVALIDSLD